jgi:mannose-6-phosphate isomerase-like protein (cupin superfamily)
MKQNVRKPGLIQPTRDTRSGSPWTWVARAQNFAVHWHESGDGELNQPIEAEDEVMVLVLGADACISGVNQEVQAKTRSVCIIPKGIWNLNLSPGCTCIVLSSIHSGVVENAVNQSAYNDPDVRIQGVGEPFKAKADSDLIRVLSIDEVKASEDKPRLKMLQSSTLSINWVEYTGPRNREALSPHAHQSFEQGSLAVVGNFVHHLRVEWGENANLWREDQHVTLGSPSLLVVPVGLIHTTEGIGDDRHLLIDIFSPPRADFISKGWIFNSKDYVK